jgi:hypothetical protein
MTGAWQASPGRCTPRSTRTFRSPADIVSQHAQFSIAAVLLNHRQPFQGTKVRQVTAFAVIAACLVLLPAAGNAKGCLKGAAVGGVVGHVAGHHAVLGAAAGCVIEHHREKVKDKTKRENTRGNRNDDG